MLYEEEIASFNAMRDPRKNGFANMDPLLGELAPPRRGVGVF